MQIKPLVLCACMLAGASDASAVDGRTVIERCNQAYTANFDKKAKINERDAAWCYGYINSTIDTVAAYQSMVKVAPPFCFREKLDMSVLLLAIVGIGPSDPASLERNGAETLINVLRTLYPCSK